MLFTLCPERAWDLSEKEKKTQKPHLPGMCSLISISFVMRIDTKI